MVVPTSASIVEHFQTIEDPRIERTKKHHLLDILVIAVCTAHSAPFGRRSTYFSRGHFAHAQLPPTVVCWHRIRGDIHYRTVFNF